MTKWQEKEHTATKSSKPRSEKVFSGMRDGDDHVYNNDSVTMIRVMDKRYNQRQKGGQGEKEIPTK